MMSADSRIYIAGHRGLVGSGILRSLKQRGYNNLITRTSKQLDLRDANAVKRLFAKEQPEYVFLAAARVGGILANDSYPVDFLQDNLQIQTNVISNAYQAGVKKLLFLGSSCIYPRDCPQPMKEEYLLTGPLEKTNQWYAIAKIAGIKLCQAYRKQYGFNAISAMPTNLYGPGDNFDLQSSHVLPALIRKFHEARINDQPEVIIWGTGTPLREFLYIDDLAEACVFLMDNYDRDQIINIGTGQDISIKALAELIGKVVGYKGKLSFDTSKPDGTPRKLQDVNRLHETGWQHQTGLRKGIEMTYRWYCKNL